VSLELMAVEEIRLNTLLKAMDAIFEPEGQSNG